MKKENSLEYEQVYLELPLVTPLITTKKIIKEEVSFIIIDLANDDDSGVIDFNIL